MSRLIRLKAMLMLLFGLLVVRLGYLQLVRGGYYRRLADQNRLRLIPELAPRGLLLDRGGRLIAANEPLYRVAVVPQDLENLSRVLTRVSAVTHRPVAVLQRAFQRERTLAFMPATLVSYVPRETAIHLEEERWTLPGLVIQAQSARAYPFGSMAGPLLGYLSQPTAEEMPLLKTYGVRPRELVGRTGLEQLLDHALRGRSGGLLVEADHRGRQIRVISRRPPEPGATVQLTLDAPLQSLIEQSFGSQAGAAVVLDAATGAVRAMVSLPSFSPAAFAIGETDTVRQYLNDSEAPLMNRAVLGVYQPGSVLKLITASAALEHGIVTPTDTVHCPGFMTIGDRTIHCWYRDGHGPMTLSDALMQSCNVYFMRLGRKLGAPRLLAALEQAGLSRRAGWPLSEQTGHLPSRRLTEGEVALLAIGQGEVLITPLQLAVIAGGFASRGRLVEPWVVDTIGGRPVSRRGSSRRLPWSSRTLETVRAGMVEVVRNASGTGHRAFTESVTIAGKTGTAQTHVPGRTHAWFAGFCPVEHPQVALAVVAEFGGSGGDLPAQIARAICEYVTLPEPAP